ncbi:ATP-dependent helicase [Clostridium porci]|uniref:DNA 3'-5' helicase n=1 Tax=Clostridium porci TaxID=2605778 RepID=A0A7X2TDK9_9CLOT|nr:ATP-dependent helicase [Clostridium porci]MSS38047.1 ATP-dependent helicase [Clostridium porci]
MENNNATEKTQRTLTSRELQGYNRCNMRRERNLSLKDAKGVENVYEKSVLIKEMIRKRLFKVATDEEIEATLEMKFMEMNYPSAETAKLHAADAYRQIMRYVHCEDRVPEVAPIKTVRPFDLFNVKVKPDYIFTGVKEFPYTKVVGKKKSTYTIPKKYIEVVKIKCSKPNVSLTSKAKDAGMMQSLELYAMLQYARSLVGPDEKDINICASYYYLRKNSDNSATKTFDTDFFENKGAGNIVTLWEEYKANGKTELDLLFQPQFEEFVNGEQVTGGGCVGCDFYEICHYTKPPTKLEAEEHGATRSVKDVKLTPTQQAVVDFRDGIACVNAGAGAGKTTSIALRTANIIAETKRPDKICMLTFTNTGAAEMSERIQQYADDLGCDADISKLTSTTFNAFGYQIVKENYEELGFSEVPKLIDEIERSAIIAELLRDTIIPGLDYRNFYVNMRTCRGALSVTRKAFEIIKKEQLVGCDPSILYRLMPTGFCTYMHRFNTAPELMDLYDKYDEILKKENLIEYADQELLVFELLKKHPDYFEKYGYEHIIVDEFQDTNELQFELLKRLIDTPSFKSFMVVGDDSQSIFAFRGSSPEYIIHFFEKLGTQGQKFDMMENHRSTPQIIEFANQINGLNKNRVEKDLVAVKDDGPDVSVRVFWKRGEDEKFAVEAIQQKHENGTAYEDIAYITYTRTELLKIGTMLTEAGIPWIMLNPEPMLENSRVIAALSLVKFISDPDATRNAMVYLNAKLDGELLQERTDEEILIGITELDADVNALLEAADEAQIPMFKALLDAIDNGDEVYQKFVEMVMQKENLEKMLEFCSLFEVYGTDQVCKREQSYPGVVLTTAHSSKGKEWPVVINNLAKYHIQELGCRFNSPDFEERRRLLFVSATRAEQKLYIIGQAVAYGSKANDTRALNQFLIESCNVTDTPFPTEPVPEKKTKGKTVA